MQCYTMFACWCNVWVLMHIFGDYAMLGWMQCLGVDSMLMHCSDDFAIFGCWCNFRVFMQCSVVDAMFRCWCNARVLMQSSGVIAMFGCFYNVRVSMQWSAVEAMWNSVSIYTIAIAASRQLAFLSELYMISSIVVFHLTIIIIIASCTIFCILLSHLVLSLL